MMRSLIPPNITVVPVTGFNNWWEASDYLYHIIDNGEGWIINCDIDCFIYDWSAVEAMVDEMKAGGFTHSGCHEGGDIPGRSRSWVCMNPFFNVFHASRIRELKGARSWDDIKHEKYRPHFDRSKPDYLGDNINHVSDEPFHGLFYWLFNVGRPLFIRTSQHSDGISTDTGFALHSWYSREYQTQKSRIHNLYEDAKHRSALS